MKKYFTGSISLLLSAIILFSCTVSGFSADTEKYTGKVLMALNTDYDYFYCEDGYYFFTGDNSAVTAGSEKKSESSGKNTADDVVDNVVVASPEEYTAYLKAHKNENQSILSSSYKVGDTKRIIAHYEDNAGRGRINIKCIYEGKDCTVWTQVFDDGSLFSSEKEAKKVADYFDSVHRAEEEIFGQNLIDADGDGKFAIISYDIYDEYGLAGYMNYDDLSNKLGFTDKVYTPSGILGGNHMDCVYLKDLTDLGTAVHEYQHYLFAGNNYRGKTNFDLPLRAETFVDEGFSMCAEVIFSEFRFDLNSAMERADEISLIDFDTDWDCYEVAGAFCTYLRNRYAVLTGDKTKDFAGKDFYLEYHGRRNRDNHYKSMEVFADILYPDNKYPGLKTSADRAKQLITDFWKAVLLNEKTGIHGFNGEEIVRGLSIEEEPPLNIEALKPGMARFYLLNSFEQGEAVIKSKSENIYFEAFDMDNICSLVYDINIDGVSETLKDYFNVGDTVLALSPEFQDFDVYKDNPGYYFAGWSENRDANKADFLPYDELTPDKDSVFYAVWKKCPAVKEGIEYGGELFSDDHLISVLFTPDESGIYSFKSSGRMELAASERGSDYIEFAYAEDTEEYTEMIFSLTAGKEYRVKLYDVNPKLLIDKCADGFTLTFAPDDNFEEKIKPYVGKTEYILPEPCLIEEKTFDIGFTGWSFNKDAKEPDRKAGEKIKLTSDAVLYAVYKPYTVITGDVIYTAEHEFDTIVFIPEKGGTYNVNFEGENLLIFDENKKLLSDSFDEGRERALAFAEGHKYYLRLSSLGGSVSIKRITDKINTKFTLLDSEYNELYSDTGKAFYTVPDVKCRDYSCPYNFWFDDSAYEAYETGDTIYVLDEVNLIPILSGDYLEPGKTYTARDAAFNVNDNRLFFFLDAEEKGVYRIKAKGGMAYYDSIYSQEDYYSDVSVPFYINTDEGCYIYINDIFEEYIIMLDPDVTEFTIEKTDDPRTVTFSAEGAENVPEPIVSNGLAYIPGSVPQKKNHEFYAWEYTYTFRGEEITELVMPDSVFFAFEDTVLTAEFEFITAFENTLLSLLDRIIERFFSIFIYLLTRFV